MIPISFKRHRIPPEIIKHAVWLYARATLASGQAGLASKALLNTA